jgi:hypothetical protein
LSAANGRFPIWRHEHRSLCGCPMTPQLNPWDSDFPHTRAAAPSTNTRLPALSSWSRTRKNAASGFRRTWKETASTAGWELGTYLTLEPNQKRENRHLAPNAVGRRRGFETCRKPFEAVSHCQPFPPSTRRRAVAQTSRGRPAQCRTSACAASAAGLPRARLLVAGCSPHAQSPNLDAPVALVALVALSPCRVSRRRN